MKKLTELIIGAKRTAEEATAEAIRFYESHLPKEALKECKVAEGTEYYARALVQKYTEIKKWRKT